MNTTMEAIDINGAAGEGGGQVLRTSLSLSVITGQPFRIYDIRARRKQPGLRPQHLACVRAAAQLCDADLAGDSVGSMELTFAPGALCSGNYHVDIGTAGSTTLVLQTVLPPLLFADSPSQVRIVGGTHNPMAPSVEFLKHTFLPQLARMGAAVNLHVEGVGFYPEGGGVIVADITPVSDWKPYVMEAWHGIETIRAVATPSKLPEHIAERELAVIQRKMGLSEEALETRYVEGLGTGNVAQIFAQGREITEVFTAIGQKGISAEKVATTVARELQAYRRAEAPVGEHLADQLLLPMAIGAGGRFRTGRPSLHATTNIAIIQQFIDVDISANPVDAYRWDLVVATNNTKGASHEIT